MTCRKLKAVSVVDTEARACWELAMGLSSAGDEHNGRGDEALSGMSNFQKVVEDVLIYNRDIKSHVNIVREALQRCAAAGITLHEEKFVFAKQEVDYCGFTVSPDGYRPDDRLIKVLIEFPTSQNRTDVRSSCRLAQQFEAFTLWLTEVLAPIRCLLSPKVEFVWRRFTKKRLNLQSESWPLQVFWQHTMNRVAYGSKQMPHNRQDLA